MDTNEREKDTKKRRTADEHRYTEIRLRKIGGDGSAKNVSAYICVNLRLDSFSLSSGPFAVVLQSADP
jgi:hypothetical protein